MYVLSSILRNKCTDI